MARLNSFHLPRSGWPAHGAMAVLDGPEAKHLLGVLRAKPGDTVRLFDGQGRHGLFEIASVSGKSSAELRLMSEEQLPPRQRGVTLALGWSKSSRRDWLLEKAVELGALGLVFWQAARSQGDVPAEPKDSWDEKCLQAAKQCQSPWVPELSVVRGGVDGLIRVAQGHGGCYVLYEGCGPDELLDPVELSQGRSLVALGPEGGLEEREVARLREAGFKARSLGPSPLRWETAALCALALAQHALQKP